MLNISRIATPIVLLEDTAIHDLSIVEKLFHRGGREWSQVGNMCSLWIVVGRVKVEDLVNSIANGTKKAAESLHEFVLSWTLKLVDFEKGNLNLDFPPEIGCANHELVS